MKLLGTVLPDDTRRPHQRMRTVYEVRPVQPELTFQPVKSRAGVEAGIEGGVEGATFGGR